MHYIANVSDITLTELNKLKGFIKVEGGEIWLCRENL